MKIVTIVLGLLILGLAAAQTGQDSFEKMKQDADRLYDQKSYALAHDIYVKMSETNPPAPAVRWLKLRIADTAWRAQASTATSDSTIYDQARTQLEAIIKDDEALPEKDKVWAETQLSLGDFWWTRRDSRNWGQAWGYYQQALDWWAGSADLDLARDKYLKIVYEITEPASRDSYYYYGYYGNYVPLPILENAAKIARTEEDKAHTHYLIAMTIRSQGGGWPQYNRVPEEFELALKANKNTTWYQYALYHYADYLENNGRATLQEDGQWENKPDYAKALELYRRLVREFRKGETQYYENAQEKIKEITKSTLSVSVSNIFLPDSEMQFESGWRNLKRIDFSVYKVDLTRDIQRPVRREDERSWVEQISVVGHEKVLTWSKETGDKGEYIPGEEPIRLPSKLPMGAYILEARGVGVAVARDLLLVTDTTLVVKTSGTQALAYFCNAIDGSPIPNAKVNLFSRGLDEDGKKWLTWNDTKTTNKDGIAMLTVPPSSRYNSDLFVSAAIDNRQAFSETNYSIYSAEKGQWKIYAMTDRPAYRPKESVQWKFIARQYDGQIYSTPANKTIEYQISDPQGAKVSEGKLTLNTFGSVWGKLDLDEKLPLGMYRVTFWNDGRSSTIGNAELFRVEEYKLPEFKINISTPEENGKKKAFRLGDKVEASVQADYYFGGAVSNANVEVLIYQTPYYHYYFPHHEYGWFYEDINNRYYNNYGGQIIKRETLKTDATGKAIVTFDTPAGGQDFEYRIEARVTDSSRREIVGSNSLRVTRQRYYVHPTPEHNIYRPQDKVAIDLKTIDANEQPVQVEGKVKITRDYWEEIWIDPSGKEVKGQELIRLRNQRRPGSAASQVGGPGWRIKTREYQHDEISTQTAKTDAEGNAQVSFTAAREGYYRISWRSQDKGAMPITAEAMVWVATNASSELGYRQGGLEIIVDKDTFRAGQTATVMLSAPVSDRYALFSVEGDDLYSYQLVHLTGTVKLINIPLTEKHTPNIFLNAAMVSQGELLSDTKQVIVPPVDQFLKVTVKADRDQYKPQDDGTLTVTTTDQNDKPVAAEVALGLTDESVNYIQKTLAGDPRQFYYGTKRYQRVQTQSTFQQKSYVRLVEGAGKELRDERERDEEDVNDRTELRKKEGEYLSKDDKAKTLAGAAGSGHRAYGAVAPPPPPSPVMSTDAIGRPTAEFGRNDAPVDRQRPGEEPAVVVRHDFKSTVLWQPDVVTNGNGSAVVKIKFPDSLTTWSATARVATSGNQFGYATSSTRTEQPLIVRLQSPRFFVVGDQVTISAVINNNTDKPMTVRPSLDASGVEVKGTNVGGTIRDPLPGPVSVDANSETRVDWTVLVQEPGNAKFKVTARNSEFADSMENSYPIYEHGLEKYVTKSGKLRGDEVAVRLDIPKERKRDTTNLTVQIAPSMAVTMLDALPYLVNYPYGCTEQTMSRFLPTAITAKTLNDMGLKPEDVMGKVFGGIDPQFAGKTHSNDKNKLDAMRSIERQSLQRLYDFQHSDGGWGWWKEGQSDHYMTAYVIWGFSLARAAGINVREDAYNRGIEYLDKTLVEETNNYDEQAWMLDALAAAHASLKQTQVSKFQTKAFDNLWENRAKLNAFTRSLFALSAHNYGFDDRAKILVENLVNGVKIDKTPDTSIILSGPQSSQEGVMGTAHWGEDGIYWRWSDGGVEATAFALRAFLAIDPNNKLVEPIVNWLVKNRRGTQWRDTRDTAITVLALNDYLRVTGEAKPDVEYDLIVNGHTVTTQKLTGENAFAAPSQFTVDNQFIKDGVNDIRLKRKSGNGPLYFSTSAAFFSQEEPVTAAGNELFVRRDYYKLVRKQTLLKGLVYERQPLNDGETVNSGDRVEVVVTVEAKNNYEYLLFEDLKPAGLEAVQLQSGTALYAQELKQGLTKGSQKARTNDQSVAYTDGGYGQSSPYTGRTQWIYQELRDRKVAMFLDKMPQGVWEIRYTLRAEVPGYFHALPILGEAMYVPEIRANGAEQRIIVKGE